MNLQNLESLAWYSSFTLLVLHKGISMTEGKSISLLFAFSQGLSRN
jgi:hypothetical protein